MTTPTMARPAAPALFGLEPDTYRQHAVHAPDRTYPETNCYTDLLIELVHARGDEPLAFLGVAARQDFEGDQWTFFKPDPRDLEDLFGIEIHEAQPYRSLPLQAEEALALGRTLTAEVDAWFLPDTAATSYGREHVKTTIAIESIDREAERLVYFHNAGLYALDGADYRGLFRIDPPGSPDVLPGYLELVRFDDAGRLGGEALRSAAIEATRRHLAHRPGANPWRVFGERLAADLPRLLAGSEADYHAYAFATVRMSGAGFELLASHVDWLLGSDGAPVVADLGRIVEGSKLLGFKLARRKAFDPSGTIDELAVAWESAMVGLDRLAGPAR